MDPFSKVGSPAPPRAHTGIAQCGAEVPAGCVLLHAGQGAARTGCASGAISRCDAELEHVFLSLQEGPYVYLSMVGNITDSDALIASLCE